MELKHVKLGTDYTYTLTHPGLEGRKCHIHGTHAHCGATLIAELWNVEGDDLAHPDELIFTEACYLTLAIVVCPPPSRWEQFKHWVYCLKVCRFLREWPK